MNTSAPLSKSLAIGFPASPVKPVAIPNITENTMRASMFLRENNGKQHDYRCDDTCNNEYR